MSDNPERGCPNWCIADHDDEDEPGSVRHRGQTHVVPAILEGRGTEGPHSAELLVERSRADGEDQTWVYVGDGWSGFSLSLESARRLAVALGAATASEADRSRRRI
jgi:hypothetical protein